MNRWVPTALGFLVAAMGALLELRHQIAFGVTMVAVGLAAALAVIGARLADGSGGPSGPAHRDRTQG
ncbi:MAG: hypothetical protein ACP5QO_05525 [Clostridia bacterium]